MSRPHHILLVEDESSHAELLRRAFEGLEDRFRLSVVPTIAEARRLVGESPPDLMITDLQLPDGRGMELLPTERDDAPYAVVVMTSHGDESIAVEAMKGGALDYVVKDEKVFSEMPHIAERALREWGLVADRKRAEGELRQREAELLQAQKMEALGRLASGIAHDFNNVLMGIRGCADVTLSKLSQDSAARPYVEEIQRAAQSASAIAGRLLTFARRRDVEREVLDLNQLAREVQGMLGTLLGAEISLEVALEAREPWVLADPGQLDQVVMNLAVNARDAMPEGGRLSLSTEDVELGSDDLKGLPELSPGRYVVLSVSDTGTGMDEATRVRAFEPFFTTKEVGKGTGLGLSTVYAVVRAAGGTIQLESSPGKGTTFRIHLPVVAATPSQRAATIGPAKHGAGQTILLVEDEPMVRLALRHYLESGGYRVLEASDAAAAVERCRTPGEHIDLVVTDVVLPGGGGRHLTENVRRYCPGVQVVYVSAHPPSVLEQEERIEPGAPVLQKPFTPDALLWRVDTVLQRARPPAEKRPGQRLGVLLVEDYPAARLATAELLREDGFDVVEAATAAQALAAHRGRAFDAVVLDLGLPDGDGTAVAAALRERQPDLCIVYTSGRPPDDPSLVAALAQPSTSFVTKPVDVAEIAAKVRELCGRPLTRDEPDAPEEARVEARSQPKPVDRESAGA